MPVAPIVLGCPHEAVEVQETLAEDGSTCMLQVVAAPMFDQIRPL